MGHLFKKHYTRDEARTLLPQIRQWLKQVSGLRQQLARCDRRLAGLLSAGHDAGGEAVHQWVRTLADIKETLREFQKREIQIKDLDRGLIDFPAILGGILLAAMIAAKRCFSAGNRTRRTSSSGTI